MTRDLRHGRLGERVEELRAVPDDAAVLLLRARQEARHVLEDEERDVERVAEPDEPRPLDRRVDVEDAGEVHRLVRDDADRAARRAGRSRRGCSARTPAWTSKNIAVVGDPADELRHVVGLVGLLGNEAVEIRASAGGVPRLAAGAGRRGCSTGGRRGARGCRRAPPRRPRRTKCATPETAACVRAPPSSSLVTSSCVTVLITSGPVTKR